MTSGVRYPSFFFFVDKLFAYSLTGHRTTATGMLRDREGTVHLEFDDGKSDIEENSGILVQSVKFPLLPAHAAR